MRVCIVCFFIFLLSAGYAQTTDSVKIVGQIIPDSGVLWKPDNAEIRVVPYNENESVYTTRVNNDGSFNVKVAVNATGLYELKYKGYKVALLLTATEPFCKVLIKTDEQQEVKQIRISGSRENDAYRIFKRESAGFKDLLRDIRDECAKDENACLAKLKKQMSAQNDLMEYLRVGYKGTYTSSVLARLGEVPELNGKGTALSQLQSGFFDDADFTDTMLYRTPDLNNKISVYLDYLADTTGPGRLRFIQHIMDKVKGRQAAQKELLTVLFNNFLDNYREPYITSLVQWAGTQHNLVDEQPVLDAKLKLLAKLVPGLPAPDVTGENLSQQTQNLLATAKSNKLTLLIFWESDCPHCRKAMPDFIRLYKEYHPKGLEVFAVSLDTDKNKWKQFIAVNHLAWQNIVLPENSSAHADYFIQYTPTVVLIDGKGNIIHRFISVEGLGQQVADILK